MNTTMTTRPQLLEVTYYSPGAATLRVNRQDLTVGMMLDLDTWHPMDMFQDGFRLLGWMRSGEPVRCTVRGASLDYGTFGAAAGSLSVGPFPIVYAAADLEALGLVESSGQLATVRCRLDTVHDLTPVRCQAIKRALDRLPEILLAGWTEPREGQK